MIFLQTISSKHVQTKKKGVKLHLKTCKNSYKINKEHESELENSKMRYNFKN